MLPHYLKFLLGISQSFVLLLRLVRETRWPLFVSFFSFPFPFFKFLKICLYINCDVLIGWSTRVIGSPEPSINTEDRRESHSTDSLFKQSLGFFHHVILMTDMDNCELLMPSWWWTNQRLLMSSWWWTNWELLMASWWWTNWELLMPSTFLSVFVLHSEENVKWLDL